MQELYVETTDQLERLCAELRGSPWLAVDTEFMREQTYYPKLCLVQIANRETAACIDPLKLEDLTPLAELLLNEKIVKVFHAARQDLEILFYLWHRVPKPLFDTQLAATLLGHGDQIGYGGLVKEVLNIDLSKDHSRTDWSRRPLSEEQRRYALDDVIYLGQAYEKMFSGLENKGRDSWLRSDFESLEDEKLYAADPAESWRRIKGYQRLRGDQLAVLKAIAEWRESRAIEADKPRRWILKDDVVLDLARRQPPNMSKLEHIRGLERGAIKHSGSHLLHLIKEAKDSPRDQWPSIETPGRRLDENEEASTDLLMCALRLRCAEHQLSPGAVTTRKTLEKMVSGERDLPILKGWKRSLVGADLLRVLNGDLVFRFIDGRLALVES